MTDNQENNLFDHVNNFFKDRFDRFDVTNDGDVDGEDSATRKILVESGNFLKNGDGENFANKTTRVIDHISDNADEIVDGIKGAAPSLDEIADGIKGVAPSLDEIGEFIGVVFKTLGKFL